MPWLRGLCLGLTVVMIGGCQCGMQAKRISECNCPTDIRKTVPWCLGEDAVFRCPCGPSPEYYGYKPTCWEVWPTSGAEWRNAYCGAPPADCPEDWESPPHDYDYESVPPGAPIPVEPEAETPPLAHLSVRKPAPQRTPDLRPRADQRQIAPATFQAPVASNKSAAPPEAAKTSSALPRNRSASVETVKPIATSRSNTPNKLEATGRPRESGSPRLESGSTTSTNRAIAKADKEPQRPLEQSNPSTNIAAMTFRDPVPTQGPVTERKAGEALESSDSAAGSHQSAIANRIDRQPMDHEIEELLGVMAARNADRPDPKPDARPLPVASEGLLQAPSLLEYRAATAKQEDAAKVFAHAEANASSSAASGSTASDTTASGSAASGTIRFRSEEPSVSQSPPVVTSNGAEHFRETFRETETTLGDSRTLPIPVAAPVPLSPRLRVRSRIPINLFDKSP